MFDSEPIIPSAFMLHEAKDEIIQEYFLSISLLVEICPNIQNTQISFVVDRKVSVTKATEKVYQTRQYFIAGIT